MNSLTIVKNVIQGKVCINIPPQFGKQVKVTIFPIEEKVEYWTHDELDNMGLIIPFTEDIDDEDYSTY
ncbi:AbrB family transcriptional regulator [Candidatus Magnetomoraceae bacterium gMMP-15]